MVATNKKVIYSKLPQGFPVEGETMTIESDTIDLHADIPENSILVKMLCLSVDPYMRGKMRDSSIKSYSAAFEVGQPLYGDSMGKVLKSRNDKYIVGDIVYGRLPFQEYTVLSEKDTTDIEVRNECKTSGFPVTNYVGVCVRNMISGFYMYLFSLIYAKGFGYARTHSIHWVKMLLFFMRFAVCLYYSD
jgi:NADPH-dependent curcumin reductase CurA